VTPGATYRIGPSDYFTSDDLLADAKTLNGQINALDGANWDKTPQSLFDGFQTFMSEWRAFYKQTFGGLFNFSAWNNGSRDELIQFETRFATFAQQYENSSGQQLPGGVVGVSSGTKDGFGDHILNQLQPLIPSISLSGVYIAAGVLAAALVVYAFRAPIGRALGKVTK